MWYWILFVAFLLLASMAYAGMQGAPWVPTWKKDIDRITELAQLKPGESFVELGCGNARICRGIRKAHADVEITGVELSLLQYLVALAQNTVSRSAIQMRLQNAFKHDLSQHDVVYVFLMPETYEKIRPKFEQELKPGSRVISYTWPIPGWEPAQVSTSNDTPTLYLYER